MDKNKQVTKTVSMLTPKELRRLKNIKLSKKKQDAFLIAYMNCRNITKASHQIGVSRQAIYQSFNIDKDFEAMFKEIDEQVTDTIESISIDVALQSDARGFNDRKLMLMARRPEKYNPQPVLQVNHTITDSNATIEARKILQGLAINTDYKVIE